MEEEFDALDALFNLGLCTYTTSYRDYNFAVTIRCVPYTEQFYSYVFPASELRQNIYLMLDFYLSDHKADYFKAGMFEPLPLTDKPLNHIPVVQLNSLEVQIKALRKIDCYHKSGSDITDFKNFMA